MLQKTNLVNNVLALVRLATEKNLIAEWVEAVELEPRHALEAAEALEEPGNCPAHKDLAKRLRRHA